MSRLTHVTPSPGPFAINQRLLDGVVTVDDDAIAEAVGLCLRRLRVVWNTAAHALWPRRPREGPAPCGRIAVVLSGGNVDWRTLAS